MRGGVYLRGGIKQARKDLQVYLLINCLSAESLPGLDAKRSESPDSEINRRGLSKKQAGAVLFAPNCLPSSRDRCPANGVPGFAIQAT